MSIDLILNTNDLIFLSLRFSEEKNEWAYHLNTLEKETE